mmetsp:Transcript_16260/g.23912  ORF Transcript_16260/g.23912 Transcript_16260/m.23912 type:complete len:209 (-) Transcript_16260:70-696(-)|eukprot:CAMPEP_0194218122 /NCGR_PEP_ID=MMETSP0156-20130528/23072_1 /TAXON_ID=33649 /ORGANISM="Thalassionema nitzschioides, Strain L26-B" /LENGTH=208 /DNA_ID=CAMNT_0038947367 /DNA_START=140 /DNA_END=766 /DNA_ORIENTATION=-
MSKPKTALDKVLYAIRNQPTTSKGVSKVAIIKYLKAELDYDNHAAIKSALKKGVDSLVLEKKGQSFRVLADTIDFVEPELKMGEKSVDTEVKVVIEDLEIGKGKKCAETGDLITVKYVGKLEDGTMFDAESSFGFTLGVGDVIKGWDQGILGMKAGGKRKIIIPPELGYEKRSFSPDIPPDSTLHFEITLKKFIKLSPDVKDPSPKTS